MFENIIKFLSQKLIDNDKIEEVYTYEAGKFKGDPTAVIVPSSNESDYETNSENERIYAFKVMLFVKRTQPRSPDTAEETMRDLVGSVIDNFDKDYTLTGLEVPSGYTFINVFASPSMWGYSGEVDEYRVCEINLTCRVSIDINLV